MAQQIRKAFRTTKIKIDEFPEETRGVLEQLYMNYEAAKTDAVSAERVAQISVNRANAKRAAASVAETELMAAAAAHNNQIASERTWLAYRGKEGKLIFEGVTDRVMRNAARAQLDDIGKKLSEESDNSSIDMYEENDEPEGDDSK